MAPATASKLMRKATPTGPALTFAGTQLRRNNSASTAFSPKAPAACEVMVSGAWVVVAGLLRALGGHRRGDRSRKSPDQPRGRTGRPEGPPSRVRKGNETWPLTMGRRREMIPVKAKSRPRVTKRPLQHIPRKCGPEQAQTATGSTRQTQFRDEVTGCADLLATIWPRDGMGQIRAQG
jgi:hypothetical protein